MTLRCAVLVSGRGGNLRALVEAIDAGTCDAEITAVLSDKERCPALDYAAARGVRTERVPPKRFEDRAAWDEALAGAIGRAEPQLVVLAGFMRIVGASVLERFGGRIINVHPSLLPKFPGLHAPQQTIDAGEAVSGCTVHLVDRGVDTGRVLAQAQLEVAPDDDAETLHRRIQALEHRLLPSVVHRFAVGELTF